MHFKILITFSLSFHFYFLYYFVVFLLLSRRFHLYCLPLRLRCSGVAQQAAYRVRIPPSLRDSFHINDNNRKSCVNWLITLLYITYRGPRSRTFLGSHDTFHKVFVKAAGLSTGSVMSLVTVWEGHGTAAWMCKEHKLKRTRLISFVSYKDNCRESRMCLRIRPVYCRGT